MIKKGSKVIVKKPLKVLEVCNGEYIDTVIVRIQFTGKYGGIEIEEVELPRSYVKEYKE